MINGGRHTRSSELNIKPKRKPMERSWKSKKTQKAKKYTQEWQQKYTKRIKEK